MRCPKCHYVSFDGQNRCRNCGYDLTLPPHEPFDLSTRPGNPTATPLADLSLNPDPPASTGGATSGVPDTFAPAPSPRHGAGSAAEHAAGGAGGASRARASEADPLDLPLFDPGPLPGAASGRGSDVADRPLISPSMPPRPPLAVRRPTGDVPRARPRVTPSAPTPAPPPRIEEPRLDLDGPDRLPDRSSAAPDRLHLDRPSRAPDRLSPSPDAAADADRAISALDRGQPGQPGAEYARAGLDRARGTPGVTPDRTRPTPDRIGAGGSAGAGGASGPAAGIGATAGYPIARPEDARTGLGRARPDLEALIGDDGPADADMSRSGSREADGDVDTSAAPLGARAIAALFDLAFLAAIDFAVLHFTLRLTGLSLDGVNRLPLAPLIGFLVLLNGGYLTMFIAASGQTMGKMMTGVQVVSMRGGAVPFGHAVLRAILWLLTIVPGGVGAIPALLTDDRRALHDRLADTRVIKVE